MEMPKHQFTSESAGRGAAACSWEEEQRGRTLSLAAYYTNALRLFSHAPECMYRMKNLSKSRIINVNGPTANIVSPLPVVFSSTHAAPPREPNAVTDPCVIQQSVVGAVVVCVSAVSLGWRWPQNREKLDSGQKKNVFIFFSRGEIFFLAEIIICRFPFFFFAVIFFPLSIMDAGATAGPSTKLHDTVYGACG